MASQREDISSSIDVFSCENTATHTKGQKGSNCRWIYISM